MTWYLTISVAVMFGWVGMFVVTPSTVRSIVRHHLWRLRDSVVDAILSGELTQSEASEDLVAQIETTILHAHRMTAWSVCFIRRPPAEWIRAEEIAQEERLAALTPEERRLIQRHEMSYRRMLGAHLLLGSPLGWIIGLIAGVFVPAVLVHHGWKSALKWLADRTSGTVESRVDLMLLRLDEAKNPSALASCV